MPKAPKGVIKRRDTEREYPTSVRIPENVLKLLKQEAVEQRRSMSWIINEILKQWYAFHTKKKKHKELTSQL